MGEVLRITCTLVMVFPVMPLTWMTDGYGVAFATSLGGGGGASLIVIGVVLLKGETVAAVHVEGDIRTAREAASRAKAIDGRAANGELRTLQRTKIVIGFPLLARIQI